MHRRYGQRVAEFLQAGLEARPTLHGGDAMSETHGATTVRDRIEGITRRADNG